MVVEIRNPIPVSEAIEKVMAYSLHGQKETISFHACDNRRLAEPIISTNHIPSFDKSPYDGFAFRTSYTTKASSDNPVKYEVVGHIGAGQLAAKDLELAQATRIMNDAQIPKGAY